MQKKNAPCQNMQNKIGLMLQGIFRNKKRIGICK